jgi:hypothetical protein
MKSFVHRDLAHVFLFAFAAGAALCFCARNSGPGESESKMTSFTSSESKAETAELFTVPSEQLGHVQIVAAEKGPLPRPLADGWWHAWACCPRRCPREWAATRKSLLRSWWSPGFCRDCSLVFLSIRCYTRLLRGKATF